MKEIKWNSIFAEEIACYLRLRESQGHTICKDRTVLITLDTCLVRLQSTKKSIPPETVEQWLRSLPRDMCVNTKIVYLSHYRQFAGYLHTLGYPAFVPESPLPDKTYVPYIFSDEEMTKLIAAADDRIQTVRKNGLVGAVQFSLLLRMLYSCGLRLNEALLLKIGDIDTENGVLLIQNAKGNKDRLVPMHPSLASALRLYMGQSPALPETYLFPSKNGVPHPQLWARNLFCQCLKIAGIEKPEMPPYVRNICLHCIRHSFAVASFRQLQQNGHDLYDEVPILSTYLGHENIHGTQRYLHMTEMNGADILRYMESMNDSIFPEVTL